MELVVNDAVSITLPQIIAFLSMFGAIIGVYYKLKHTIDNLTEMFKAMTERNRAADEETKVVKKEQAEQKTSIAVMTTQMQHFSTLLSRVDRNVDEIVKKDRSKNS